MEEAHAWDSYVWLLFCAAYSSFGDLTGCLTRVSWRFDKSRVASSTAMRTGAPTWAKLISVPDQQFIYPLGGALRPFFAHAVLRGHTWGHSRWPLATVCSEKDKSAPPLWYINCWLGIGVDLNINTKVRKHLSRFRSLFIGRKQFFKDMKTLSGVMAWLTYSKIEHDKRNKKIRYKIKCWNNKRN